MENRENMSVRDRLILCGLDELNRNGVRNFSLRKVATAAGVSCAAPYKHFRDIDELVLEIIRYINESWACVHDKTVSEVSGGAREKLVAVSMAYVRFLLDNPSFFTIIMIRDDSLNEMQKRARADISVKTKRLIHEYCESVGMSREDEVRKTYTVRSLIYGAMILVSAGELDSSEEIMAMVRSVIEREFDLS